MNYFLILYLKKATLFLFFGTVRSLSLLPHIGLQQLSPAEAKVRRTATLHFLQREPNGMYLQGHSPAKVSDLDGFLVDC
jgi:hypothetical protein